MCFNVLSREMSQEGIEQVGKSGSEIKCEPPLQNFSLEI